MREENDLFSILLSLEKLNKVYSDVGNTIINNMDIAGYGYNSRTLNKSLILLMKTGLIDIIDGAYIKTKIQSDLVFSDILINRIFSLFSDEIFANLKGKQQYDLETKLTYFDKNAVSLKYSGLMMLFEEYGEVVTSGTRWEITGEKLSRLLSSEEKSRKLSLEELENRLLRQKVLGAEAEEYIMNYEKKKLSTIGIVKSPIQISLVDSNAGFDILSYGKSETDEIYIEVKSTENKMEFHFTRNEISTAKKLGERYWLYLFNRINKSITMLENPYKLFFVEESSDWALEPDGYVIHKI